MGQQEKKGQWRECANTGESLHSPDYTDYLVEGKLLKTVAVCVSRYFQGHI